MFKHFEHSASNITFIILFLVLGIEKD